MGAWRVPLSQGLKQHFVKYLLWLMIYAQLEKITRKRPVAISNLFVFLWQCFPWMTQRCASVCVLVKFQNYEISVPGGTDMSRVPGLPVLLCQAVRVWVTVFETFKVCLRPLGTYASECFWEGQTCLGLRGSVCFLFKFDKTLAHDLEHAGLSKRVDKK